MAFFDRHRVLAGWRELRQDFRHFRADRVRSVTALSERYPEPRARLIERWSHQLCSRTDRN
jgi:predicted DNA-binding transcriptional regulator YafY